MIKLRTVNCSVEILAISYLALPVLVFLWGWFVWWAALIASISLVMVLYKIDTNWPQKRDIPTKKWWLNHLILLLISCVWTYLSGIGGFRPQHFDYYKHNLILNNLVLFDWPVRYADSYLCYYNAYYLVPAFLAKMIGGIAFVHFYMFGWAWLGLLLLFELLYKIGKWGFVTVFMLFNSAEVILLVYEAYKSTDTIVPTLQNLWTNDHTIELIFMRGGLTYPSHVEALTAVPQHAIASWLATAILIRLITNHVTLKFEILVVGLLTSLLLYWSPFVAVGLFALWVLSGQWLVASRKYPAASNPPSLTPHLSSLISGTPPAHHSSAERRPLTPHHSSFIIHHSSFISIALPAMIYYAGHVPMHDINDWMLNYLKTPHQYLLFVAFLLMEAVLWAALVWFLEIKFKILGTNFKLVMAATFILFLLPFYRYGHYNDFMRRASFPAVMVLSWGVWQILSYFIQREDPLLKQQKVFKLSKIIVWICVVLMAILPVKHHLKWLTPQPYLGVTSKSIVDFTPHTIHHLQSYHQGEFDVVSQYLGDTNAVYFRYLARK